MKALPCESASQRLRSQTRSTSTAIFDMTMRSFIIFFFLTTFIGYEPLSGGIAALDLKLPR